MYIFELEDTTQGNSIVIVVAYTYEDAVVAYLTDRWGERMQDVPIDKIHLVRRHDIVLGVITWRDD